MKKINGGVLGTARIARQHVIPGIKKSKNSNLYAIASRNISNFNEMKTTKLSIGGVSWWRWDGGRLRHNRDIVVESHFFGDGCKSHIR